MLHLEIWKRGQRGATGQKEVREVAQPDSEGHQYLPDMSQLIIPFRFNPGLRSHTLNLTGVVGKPFDEAGVSLGSYRRASE